MKIKKPDTQKEKSSSKRSLNSFFIIFAITVLAIILLFFIWHQISLNSLTDVKNFDTKTVPVDISVSTPPPPTKTITKSSLNADVNATDQPETVQTTTIVVVKQSETETFDNTYAEKSDSSPFPNNQQPGAFTKTCSESTDIIRRFYRHLDLQDYMKPYDLKVSIEEHFTHLIQRLLDNPPVVSGETNDLFTILQNTAHFYRIIGKDNILILKGILDREKNQFENVLNHFYSIFQTPSCPRDSFNLLVTETSLYDYAGFFLNTMGGRLYLFRRDSMSRIVVSYYAILLVDQANKEARNKYGIAIKTAIDQVIDDMEASSKQFKLEKVYLDNLYKLKEQYQ